MSLALALAVSAMPLAGQTTEAYALPAAMPAEGRAALAWLSAQRPENDSARLELDRNRMRVLHALAAADGDWMDSARAQLHVLDRREAPAITQAYAGALAMLDGKYALWPPRKLEYVRAGRRDLDAAVRAAPDDVEVRYVRLVSGHYLPFFLRDDEQVEADARAVARLLPAQAHRFPAEWAANLARFVLDVAAIDERTAVPLRRMSATR